MLPTLKFSLFMPPSRGGSGFFTGPRPRGSPLDPECPGRHPWKNLVVRRPNAWTQNKSKSLEHYWPRSMSW